MPLTPRHLCLTVNSSLEHSGPLRPQPPRTVVADANPHRGGIAIGPVWFAACADRSKDSINRMSKPNLLAMRWTTCAETTRSRGERRTRALAPPREATLGADAVLLAVHWSPVDDVLKQAGDLSGKVIISCSLPMNASDTALAVAHRSSGAEALAKRKVRKAESFRFRTVERSAV